MKTLLGQSCNQRGEDRTNHPSRNELNRCHLEREQRDNPKGSRSTSTCAWTSFGALKYKPYAAKKNTQLGISAGKVHLVPRG